MLNVCPNSDQIRPFSIIVFTILNISASNASEAMHVVGDVIL